MTWKMELDVDGDDWRAYEGSLGFILDMDAHEQTLSEWVYRYDCQWCTETFESPNIEALMHRVIVQHLGTHFGGLSEDE